MDSEHKQSSGCLDDLVRGVLVPLVLVLALVGCSREKTDVTELLARFDIPDEHLEAAREYFSRATLHESDPLTGQIAMGDAFLVYPAQRLKRLSVTVPADKASSGPGLSPIGVGGMVTMAAPMSRAKSRFVATRRIRFHVACSKETTHSGAIAVRSFATVRRDDLRLTQCLALVHRDVPESELEGGTFELELLLEPSVLAEYSVFVYVGPPLDGETFSAYWHFRKSARPADDWGKDHQALSNLVEVQVRVTPER